MYLSPVVLERFILVELFFDLDGPIGDLLPMEAKILRVWNCRAAASQAPEGRESIT